LPKPPVKRGEGGKTKSAFDRNERYELTELGRQFVHYAMNELAPRLTFDEGDEPSKKGATEAHNV